MLIEKLFNQEQKGLPHRMWANLKVRYRNKKTRGKKELADKNMRSYFTQEETKKLIGILKEMQPTR